MRKTWNIVPLLLLAVLSGTGMSQTISTHPASWLKETTGNLFFRLNGDGSLLLVNRSTTAEKEEMVVIPTAGGSETIWYSSEGRSIYDRIAFSEKGDTVAFAKSPGRRVYVVTRPGGEPIVVANTGSYGDPRQLCMSADGKWVAFTASSGLTNSPGGRVHANLYVAAADGSIVHQITSKTLPGKFIPFALSEDGKTVIWVDGPDKDPVVAGIDGKNAKRVITAKKGIRNVACSKDGSTIYYEILDGDGLEIRSIGSDGNGEKLLHSAAHGKYHVASGNGRIRLDQFDARQKPCGRTWLVKDGGLKEMFTFRRPMIGGSRTWSRDGRVMVWRTRFSPWVDKTMVWRDEG